MLTPEQSEILTNLLNAGVGRAGTVLSELVGCQVRMQVPLVGVTEFKDLHACLGIEDNLQLVSVCQQFHGSLDGYALLVLSRENGNALTKRLVDEDIDPDSMDTERSEALVEVGNILTNSVLGTISNTVGHRFEYQVPVYREGSLPEIIGLSSCASSCSVCDSQTLYAKAHFDFDAARVIGSVLILLTAGSFDRLLELVGNLPTGAK
jgi:chemotaxis protein CheC